MNNHDKMLSAITEIIEQSSSLRMNANLRIVLMDYLILHDDYPINIKEILSDFNIMFDLLDLLSKLDTTNSEGPPH